MSTAPHLSHSRLSRYLLCPEQYRLYYVENLRLVIQPANLLFGQMIHEALACLFRQGDDPVPFFDQAWREVQDAPMSFSYRSSWEKLRATGLELLRRFVRNELPKFSDVQAVEKSFSLSVTGLSLPLIGIIDLVVRLDGKKTVVDFKTAAASYAPHEAALSDQLTTYQLAEPDCEQTALCVFVKTKDPRIEWHRTTRTGDHLVEFLLKADFATRDIAAGRFYKRPGKWCSWCDYLPVCLGDDKKVSENLVQIR